MRKPTIWAPNRSDTNRAVQSQNKVKSLKVWLKKKRNCTILVWFKEEEELYYPCSENPGADELRSYCEADLRLCFCICRLLYRGSFKSISFKLGNVQRVIYFVNPATCPLCWGILLGLKKPSVESNTIDKTVQENKGQMMLYFFDET